METVSEETRGRAWLEAIKILRNQRSMVYNLIVEIREPGLASVINKAAQDELDTLLVSASDHVCDTVAETIFPAWECKRHGADGVYSVYPDEVYPAISSLPANNWGTYAYRLVRRIDEDGHTYNPLERIVSKLKGELANHGPKRAVYEIDVFGNGLSTYYPEHDWNNYMGGQCLSHISLKIGPSRELYLTALYRYQFFVRKALGNFLGLARLQEFIAREVGMKSGPLVCHATLANLDLHSRFWGLTEIDDLIKKLDALPSSEDL